MSLEIYFVGQVANLTWEVQVDGVDTEPPTFTAIITHPDGTPEELTVANPDSGVYTKAYQIPEAGHFTWKAVSTGDVAVAFGSFDAFEADPPQQPELVGVLGPWIGAADIASRRSVIDAIAAGTEITPSTMAAAARISTELLYALSGRQFPGIARTYCRPVPRAQGWDARSWGAYTGFGYWDSWGVAGGYSMGYGAATAPAFGMHAGSAYPPEIALNYPVRRIEEVKIDGTTIPTDEYRIDNNRFLVRVRPTAAAVPTARGGWPSMQALTLPDTEMGTFSVTYWYGTGPGVLGQEACAILATEFTLNMVGADNRLPQRITGLNRQGESITILDAAVALKDGLTGIPEVDFFIKSCNPNGLQRRASVWSPDMGRNRTPTG